LGIWHRACCICGQIGNSYLKKKRGEEMRWYSIFHDVPKGTGDWGSDNKCIFDGYSTESIILGIAASLASEVQQRVMIFRGKNVGRLWRTVYVNGRIEP
jgi:hypothetical protein